MKILVAYATTHGSTAEIAKFIGQILAEHDAQVTVEAVENITSVTDYDAFVIGTPIYGGMWLTQMSHFLDTFEAELARKPVYFWISCIRVLEQDGYQHALDNYIHKPTLEKIGVKTVAVFAGKLKLDAIDWNERWTLSAKYDGSVLPGTRDDDFRDWNAIRAWASKVRDELVKI